MKCSALETLIENHEPIDLIDVRKTGAFAAMHIRGAHSLPLAELAAPHIYHRPPHKARIYVVSEDNATASMAAGILHSGGWTDPVIVDGGMKAWIAQGFPVHKSLFFKRSMHLQAGSILSGISAGAALMLHDFLVGLSCIAISGALSLKGHFLSGKAGGEGGYIDIAPGSEISPAHNRMSLIAGIGHLMTPHHQHKSMGDVLSFWFVMLSPLIGIVLGLVGAWIFAR